MSFSFHRQIPNRISTSIKKATKTLHSIISTSPFAQRPPTLAIFSDIIRKIEVVNQSKALASILPYMVELLRCRNKKRIFPTPRTTGKRSSFLQINPQKLKKDGASNKQILSSIFSVPRLPLHTTWEILLYF